MEHRLLSDVLSPAAVLVPLSASDPAAAIEALAGALSLSNGPDARRELVAAALEREKAGSTGIGHGVAIPHARSTRIAQPRLAVGLVAAPIDFKAADGKPVALVFLLAVPESAPRSHLKVLAALSRIAMDQKLLKRLMKASSAKELHELVAGRPLG